MSNVEVLNTVDLNEELATIANVNAELSEEQLDNVSAGRRVPSFDCDEEMEIEISGGKVTHYSYTSK
jgi:hypothetical protein